MSMSTHLIGFRPPDAVWAKMKVAYDACIAAGVPVPEPVLAFFAYSPPDPRGVEVSIEKTPAVRVYEREGASGFEVDVRGLPDGVTVVRFYNSW